MTDDEETAKSVVIEMKRAIHSKLSGDLSDAEFRKTRLDLLVRYRELSCHLVYPSNIDAHSDVRQ